jgi:antirestriction protein
MTTATLEVTTTPRIYVADLAAYNNGILHGEWIEVGTGLDASCDIYTSIGEMLKASPVTGAEEWAIHDSEGFGCNVGEYANIEQLIELAELIEEHSAELVAGLMDNYSNIDEVRRALEDNYMGEYESLADYMQELTEECTEIPESLRNYIDYDSMAHDEECNGTYTQIEVNGRVHIFTNY